MSDLRKQVSVVLTTYRRLATIERVIRAWLAVSDDVWLGDCSGGGWDCPHDLRVDHRFTHVRFDPDPGNKVMHALGTLTRGDFVIYGDDDLVPLPGLVEDYMAGWDKVGGVVGLIGRRFTSEAYYSTEWYGAKKIDSPVEVGFCSYAFTPRAYLGFDLRGCENAIEDLFWHMREFPDVRKHVIPSQNFETLPDASDKGCLFHDKQARAEREAFYREWYHRNFERGAVA